MLTFHFPEASSGPVIAIVIVALIIVIVIVVAVVFILVALIIITTTAAATDEHEYGCDEYNKSCGEECEVPYGDGCYYDVDGTDGDDYGNDVDALAVA